MSFAMRSKGNSAVLPGNDLYQVLCYLHPNLSVNRKMNFFTVDKNGHFTHVNVNDLQHARYIVQGANIGEQYPNGVGTAFYQACLKAMECQQNIFIETYYSPNDSWCEKHIYPKRL